MRNCSSWPRISPRVVERAARGRTRPRAASSAGRPPPRGRPRSAAGSARRSLQLLAGPVAPAGASRRRSSHVSPRRPGLARRGTWRTGSRDRRRLLLHRLREQADEQVQLLQRVGAEPLRAGRQVVQQRPCRRPHSGRRARSRGPLGREVMEEAPWSCRRRRSPRRPRSPRTRARARAAATHRGCAHASCAPSRATDRQSTYPNGLSRTHMIAQECG